MSLRELLTRFDITFEISDTHLRKQKYQKLRGEGLSLEQIKQQLSWGNKEYLAKAAAYHRDDRVPAQDVGIEYGIISWDEKAADNLVVLIRDLVHAASCGCDGCAERIDRRLEQINGRRK